MSQVTILQAWPGYMKVETAAAYLDMRRADFLKAVAGGALPQPVLIDGKERWRLAEIDGMFDAPKAEKPWLMSIE
jgi:predicted DNA-binding transcriptional regulator AlpA